MPARELSPLTKSIVTADPCWFAASSEPVAGTRGALVSGCLGVFAGADALRADAGLLRVTTVSDLSAQWRPKLSVITCIRGFYAVLDRDDEALAEQLVSLDHAGARVLQVRLKAASPQQLRATAIMARRITQQHGAALIINDDITLALEIGAEGVHLGQTDVPIMAAREQVMAYRAGLSADVAATLAPFWIGISTHTPSQVTSACKAGANYIGCGPVYATTTKANPDPVIGLQGLQGACRLSTVPVVAIGGIAIQHATAVYATGAAAICAISAVNNSTDVTRAGKLFARPF